MTPKEQTRLQVLGSLLAEHMTLDQAATLMGVSTRHTRRLLAAYQEKGAAAVAHGHRGRGAPNATPKAVAYGVVHLARTKYLGANHTHLSELLNEREGIDLGRTTLRRILVDAGLTSPRRRRPPKHRVRRQRMPQQGMLIQMDGSYHPWLGDQVPPFTLLIAVDDATGTVAGALFCEKEETYTYFLMIQDLVQSVGIPVALYVDRHGVFRHTPGSGLPGTSTQFSRAMDELGIQMIFALSPQAKGRVERTAGTFQDRLVTELRMAGAGSIGDANGVLEQFLPRFNRRFRVPPQCSESAYRPLETGLRLEQVLCFKHRRKVAKDNTVKFQLHTLQLLPEPERPSYAGAVVEVLEGLDGQLRVRYEGRIINAQEAPPSPVFLRNGKGSTETPVVPPSGANGLGQRWAATLKSLDSRAADEEHQADMTGGGPATSTSATVSPRKPPSCRRRGGRRFRKPGARRCRCGRSRGSWGSTEPPSRNTWMPTVLQGGGPSRLSLQHLIQWRHNRVTFMLAFDTPLVHNHDALDSDHPAAHHAGLRPADALVGGRGLPRRPGDPPGFGQLEHPSDGVLVRYLSGLGGPAHRQAAGVPLHAQARQLVEYGRDRVQCAGPGLPAGRDADEDSLAKAVNACVSERNTAEAAIDWRFTASTRAILDLTQY